MGSCISSQYSYPALDPSKLIPILSSNCIKKMRKKRKAAVDAAENNADSSDRRPTVSLECAEEEELQQVHGRLFVNGASEVACLYTQQGKKGTNQDAMLVWENFASRKNTIFCGVFDGHGPYGHLVSKKVRDYLPLKLRSQWENYISGHSRNGSMDSQDTTVSSILDTEEVDNVNEKTPAMYNILRQSLLKAFKLMDKELKHSPTINSFCSGSTAVTVIKQGNDLVIGNVGDSRAIVGTRDNDNNLVAEQLTVDLKPNLPKEAERIQRCNGRVFALQDEPEVARVWLPNNDSPGLAMARAFGDFCLKDYGLISVPDISYRCISDKDEFIVLASDGVWDALSNKEVVDIVASAPTRGTAARALVDSAVRSWRLKYPTSKIDDCAAICLFLEPTQIDSCELPKVEAHTEVDELSTSQTQTSSLNPDTNIDEIVAISEEHKEEKLAERSKSLRSLAECISNSEEEEWSALEGITRVNSFLNLPRFLSGDKRSARRKWCS